jgi:oligopeptide/dipeptide ABC transporter ATP-binding protein
MSDPTTDAGAAPLLEARGIKVSFEGRQGMVAGLTGKQVIRAQAVDGVDLVVKAGEIVALAGESGCGKTTLARTIMGLEVPQEGQILFEGEPIGTKTRALRAYRKRVQLVFQDPAAALNPRQTIYESVAEGLRIHKVPGDEERLVADALSRAGLRPPERFFLLYPHEVSGGQRQRVVIAGALALDPDLLVADEPVSALDASVRGEILRLLLKLRDELGLAIIVVTHDLGLAWMIADRIAVMYLGRIVEEGPTEQVLTSPQHPYTQALLSVVPETKGMEQVILTGEPPDPTRIPPGCRFHPRCPLVADGSAARLGIEDRCKGEDLALERVAEDHLSACFAARIPGGLPKLEASRPEAPGAPEAPEPPAAE